MKACVLLGRPGPAVWAIMLGSVAFRVIALGDYPSANPDEGLWASGARNLVLFGSPLMDGLLHPFLSPATFAALAVWFSVLGPGLVSARLFSACASLVTCCLVTKLSFRLGLAVPLAFPLLFGLSSFMVLIGRTIILEAHQTLWLVLAAVLWLVGWRGRVRPLLAGCALGLACLVKINALYVLPAFVLSSPRREATGPETLNPTLSGFLWLLLGIGAVSGAGFGLVAWIDVVAFKAAFSYELIPVLGVHLLETDTWFHFGRLGFHPQAVKTLGELALNDPLGLAAAAVGFVGILSRLRRATRADRLFAAWLVCGLAVNLGQVYSPLRYLATIDPAIAYLAARCLERLRVVPLVRLARLDLTPALAVLLLFASVHTARVAAGIHRQANLRYWQTVQWIREYIPPDRVVLAAPYLLLDLPNRGYGFHRLMVPYDRTEPRVPLAAVMSRYQVAVFVVDPEWLELDADIPGSRAEFARQHCEALVEIGEFTVCRPRGLEPQAAKP